MATLQNNAYLREENLLSLFSLNRLIVPEIQREYVWGNNTDVLTQFLNDIRAKAEPCSVCHHVHAAKSMNVGFLYSYKPNYVKRSYERILDEYLIDGQQRITTLFLLLLYRASVEDRLSDFLAIIRAYDGPSTIAFNYKVRNLTQRFVLDLISWTEKMGKKAFDFVDSMDDTPSWMLDDYLTDPTVMAMISAIKVMRDVFKDDDNYYFDFLLTNIRFWHFKTEATSQGEELYITMNLRGEQLSDNEMTKARALPQDELTNHGMDWESWQTFFWRNRKKSVENPNADKGFNAFLACIEGYVSFFKGKAYKANIFDITSAMWALQYVTGNDVKDGNGNTVFSNNFRKELETKYNGLYTTWYDNFLNDIWTIIDKDSIDWHIDNYKLSKDAEARTLYNNSSVARNASMLIWPWLYYFSTLASSQQPDDDVLIHLLHLYYVRFHCYQRSSTTIERVVDNIVKYYRDNDSIDNSEAGDDDADIDDFDHLFSEEEMLLFKLCGKDRTAESIAWKLQDLPYFIGERKLGGYTIRNFIRKEVGIIDWAKPTESLTALYDFINTLLPDGNADGGNIPVKEALLFYTKGSESEFWRRIGPGYYYVYETCKWKRIVRASWFLIFYREYNSFCQKHLAHDGNPVVSTDNIMHSFLEEKRQTFFRQEQESNNVNIAEWSHRNLCILYDALCPQGIWGNDYPHIVFYEEDNPSPSKDALYHGQNGKRGKPYWADRIDLPGDWEEQLAKKYQFNEQD